MCTYNMSQFSKPTHCTSIVPCEDCDRCKTFMDICALPNSTPWSLFKEDLIVNHLLLEYKKKQDSEDLNRRRELLGLKIKQNKKHHFITISLDPKKLIIPDELNPKFKYKYLDESIFCYEFFGKELQFHPHIHMLVEAYDNGKIIPKSTIVRDFSRALKVDNNFIDVKSEPWLYNKRRAYILGDKKEEKMEQINMDREYRLKNNIDEYYTI